MNWTIDSELIKQAIETESVRLVDGKDKDGTRIIVIVATGATAGLLVQRLKESGVLIFPEDQT